jgi:hypothetical protein
MLFSAWLLLGMGLTILALALAVSFIVLFVMGWGWLGTAITRLFRKAREHDPASRAEAVPGSHH